MVTQRACYRDRKVGNSTNPNRLASPFGTSGVNIFRTLLLLLPLIIPQEIRGRNGYIYSNKTWFAYGDLLGARRRVLDQLLVSISIGTRNAFNQNFPVQKCWTFCMVDLMLPLSSSNVLELLGCSI